MKQDSQWKDKIFNVTAAGFPELALEIFHFQYAENPVYRQYVDVLGIDPTRIRELEQIPFLPIQFFKTHRVQAGSTVEMVFESSGTTGSSTSKHYITNPDFYKESFTRTFRSFYGKEEEYCILGLLPSYLERQHSSLVYMVDHLIRNSGHPSGGFYLEDQAKLVSVLEELKKENQKTLLIGVSFALLDLAETFPVKLENTIIMETGGMKGRRKELVRQELHELLKAAFGVSTIHSEYGMTELLSQSYSRGEGWFESPPWMRFLVRDEEDPLKLRSAGTGVLNVIDLANIYSCSFLATEDVGSIHGNGQFEVLGRIDNTDLRGCSLLVS